MKRIVLGMAAVLAFGTAAAQSSAPAPAVAPEASAQAVVQAPATAPVATNAAAKAKTKVQGTWMAAGFGVAVVAAGLASGGGSDKKSSP